MGSGKPGCSSGAGASGPPPLCAAVCCMCGDRGLLPELFRCAACSVRSQHTYCTDRYPKVESYGTCNWCLRAGQGNNAAGAGTASRSARPSTVRSAAAVAGHGQDVTGRSGPAKQLVAARGDFATGLSKPIKKPPPTQTTSPQQRRLLLRRSASDLGISRVRGAGHNAPPSPGVARGRPRVRRYKLLDEVITR